MEKGFESQKNNEKLEKFTELELKLQEPYLDKNWMIIFSIENELMKKFYDTAISEICKENNLNVFHQIDCKNTDGYFSGWEFWSKVTKEQLENLFPKIHEIARQRFDYYKEHDWL